MLVDFPVKGCMAEEHVRGGDLDEITLERTPVELLKVDLPACGGLVELVDVPRRMPQDQRFDGRESGVFHDCGFLMLRRIRLDFNIEQPIRSGSDRGFVTVAVGHGPTEV